MGLQFDNIAAASRGELLSSSAHNNLVFAIVINGAVLQPDACCFGLFC